MVELKNEKNVFGLKLNSPEGTTAVVGIPKSPISPTVIEINDSVVWKNGKFVSGVKGISWNGEGKHHDYVHGIVVSQGIKARHAFPQRSVHDGRYHYIHSFNTKERTEKNSNADPVIDYFLKRGAEEHPDVPEEILFDTQTDPHEMINLAQKPDMEEIKKRLKTELFRWMKTHNDYLSENGPVPMLEVREKYSLDQMDLSYYTYEIPEEKIGSLKGKTINPHGATAPKAK